MLNGNSQYNYADLNGLVYTTVDELNVNDTFQDTNATYYNNITSNIQDQLNNLVTISSNIINYNYLQNQINTISSSVNSINTLLTNTSYDSISKILVINDRLQVKGNLFISSYLVILATGIYYAIPVSRFLYFDPVASIQTQFNTISGSLINYISSNNDYVLSLSNSIKLIKNVLTDITYDSVQKYVNIANNVHIYGALLIASGITLRNIGYKIIPNTALQYIDCTSSVQTQFNTISGSLINYISSNNNVNSYTSLYLNSLSGMIKNIELIPGPKGDPGINGTNGSNGSNGSNGQRGEKGDKGDTGDTGPAGSNADAGLILSVVNAAVTSAVVAGGVTSLSMLSTQVQTIQAETAINTSNITVLNGKTQFQSVLGSTTNFSGDVTVSNPILNVRLSSDATTTSKFYSGIECDAGSIMNGLQVNNGLQSDTIQANSISVDNNKFKMFTNNNTNQISYNGISTGIRDCAVEFASPVFNPFFHSDIGTINMRAGSINIGNVDQTSVIYLNGIVYFNNVINTGFFNQFA